MPYLGYLLAAIAGAMIAVFGICLLIVSKRPGIRSTLFPPDKGGPP